MSEIMKWLHAHGHDDQQARWYVDKESGKTLRRDAFQRLQQDIFAGKVGMVVIWKLDRLSRRLRDRREHPRRLVREGSDRSSSSLSRSNSTGPSAG